MAAGGSDFGDEASLTLTKMAEGTKKSVILRIASQHEPSENDQVMDTIPEDPVQHWLDRLVAVLRRQAGRQLSEAERKAGVQPGYLRKAQSASGNVMLRRFLRVCHAADLNPGDIFAEVFPKTDYDPDFGLIVPKGPLPQIVAKARGRFQGQSEHPVVGAEWLEWLDELRYDDPRRATEVSEASLDAIPDEYLPRLLGIWASACRTLASYKEATLALREALRLARAREDSLAEADLLRRGASLVGSASANYPTALMVAGKAVAICARLGNVDKMGRAMVSQGVFLYYLDRLSEAEVAIESALVFLEETSIRDRIAVFQVLGLISHARRQPQRALKFIGKALPLASTHYQIGKLSWLQGCILSDLDRWDMAHLAFEDAHNSLIKAAPIDAALAACDQVRLLLASRRIQDARLRIFEMRKLMEPLAGHLIASAAIRDLIRCEREGVRLTTTLILKIKKRVEEGRRIGTRRPS